MATRSFFHLHLVSDSTGETLIMAGRAVAAQYPAVSALEHIYPLVRSERDLDRTIAEIEANPGVVLYTLVEPELAERLERSCREMGAPVLSVLQPIFDLFKSYLGTEVMVKPGAQHVLNADYFRRIDALNYTMMHDDGLMPTDYEEADVLLLGVSRTSKTPTSIYLAHRGVKTANIPLVPGVPLPPEVEHLKNPLIVGLFASPERIVQIRENRVLTLSPHHDVDTYTDRMAVAEEIAQSRRLFSQRGWPMIDVTRRSIEETAAAIQGLLRAHRRARIVET
ncbi:kinase/pyrophosphorylase [Labrys sp. LIt4]|uniref:Putative pyruvate, phosphate dikinase regulatory protein n=1 Tax=Labrys okinawensis TaxID=346911 RepID=A0A2S9QGV5_9HYPH|nr:MULTISPECIES: pyruvate, water dikinase regulatory protein [Labrys]MBP0579478.1 kinase/pyrophosphorylase [Labrys sp. LIt4]PRH88596.1 phosphoenolpyruvate synthase regulatory protein [Labrys okinawensis]